MFGHKAWPWAFQILSLKSATEILQVKHVFILRRSRTLLQSYATQEQFLTQKVKILSPSTVKKGPS